MKRRDLDRREFVGSLSATLGGATLGGTLGSATMMTLTGHASVPIKDAWLDCNVTMGRWPFRQLPDQSPDQLSFKLLQLGVTQAWVGSFEAVFQDDIQAANMQLVQACRKATAKNLLPVATINPALANWRADLIQAHEQLSISIIRLYPNYHSYTLDDACFADFIDFATERKLAIQVVVQIEDDRTHPIRMQVPAVDLKPLPKLLLKQPAARVMVLNATRPQLEPIIPCEGVLFDIAKIEGVIALEQILETVNHERIVFGSHSPFFYWEAARLKLQESGLLDRQFDAIEQGNAKKWINQ